jgi:putative PIN family toxin of toxin-antitoxin system
MVSPVRLAARVVLDTHVLVSGLLTPAGSSARLMDLAQRGEIRLLYDGRIFQEYAEALRRPHFGFSLPAVDRFLEFLVTEGELVVARPLKPAGVGPSDQPFFEVAISGAAQLLVTGNRKHFPQLSPKGLDIVSPAEALKRLAGNL